MLGDQHEQAAEIDDLLAVEFQTGDRGTARGCEPKNLREIAGPGEVVAPRIAPRVVERDTRTAPRIDRLGAGVLEAVTTLAGVSEVCGTVAPTARPGNDVLNRKRVGGV